MLKQLLIKNFALIKHLEMAPSPNLNIITGETGAGKSIMLGAVGLLLGNRADAKSLLNEEEKCIIEAQFDIGDYQLKEIFESADIDYDTNCIIRREINTAGKSRAFVNDTPVTLDLLKKIGSKLMDVHSQHETLALGNSSFQLSILDAFAANKPIVEQYKEIYKQHKTTLEQFEHLKEQSNKEKAQLSFNTFLFDELEEANLSIGEQEILEQKQKNLSNAEDIKAKLVNASLLLGGGASDTISNLIALDKLLLQLSSFNPSIEPLQQRLKASLTELKDIQAEIEDLEQNTNFDPEELPNIQERLSTIYHLQKKHGVNSISEILEIKTQLEQKINEVENIDDTLLQLKQTLDEQQKELEQVAKKLSQTRLAVVPRIVEELTQLLKEVGILNANIKIEHQISQPSPLGIDEVSLLFSANKGVAPQELKHVASGGEFSRLMLCIKYLLADKTALPTIVFDEIDTGISGEIAMKVGKMMKQMAAKHQVISISHLPQIAAQGEAHYFVYKDNSQEKAVSKMKKLNQEERIQEIAQMLSGAKPSPSALENAKELMKASVLN